MFHIDCSRWWFSAILAVLIVIRDCNGASNVSAECDQKCYIDTHPTVKDWMWIGENVMFGQPTTTMTKTVVTIVNTVANATSITTKMPADYTPYPTNANGTRIGTAVYTQSGQTITTILTYPTAFIAWPDYLRWTGTIKAPAASECITAANWSTVSLSSIPQPTQIDWTGDPRYPDGSNYVLVHALSSSFAWPYYDYSTLFNHPAPTICSVPSGGPNWGGWSSTAWYTAHEISQA
ncbi:hypothetical protein F4819DRAFT_446347 [Hypoxylon fuscum]|nr:hypothetical protein F4819DRAFT_446347 [Hypoxylon fuscum]